MADMENNQAEVMPSSENEIEEQKSAAMEAVNDESAAEVEESNAADEQDEGPDVEDVVEEHEEEVAVAAEAEDAGGEKEVEPELAGKEEKIDTTIEGEAKEIETEDESEETEVSEESEVEAESEPEMAHEEDVPTAGVSEEPEVAEAQDTEPAGESDPDDDRHWYVVHCYSGYEKKVHHNLEQRIDTMGMKSKIFDVVVPTEEEIEVKNGKRRTVESRVFPGYILVQMILTEESWYVVRNTPGVTGFVGMGNEPTPLRPEEVASIIKRMEAEAPRIKVTYSIDQKVRIIDGPFNDFIGTVDDIDMDKAKVRVMVSFFGRETPVELDFLQVEKA